MIGVSLALAAVEWASLRDIFDPARISPYIDHATRAELSFFHSTESGLFAFGTQLAWQLLVAGLLWPLFRDGEFRNWRSFAAAGLGIVSMMGGGKTVVLYVGLLIAIGVHYRQHRIPGALVACTAVLLYVPMTMLPNVRFTTNLATMWSAGSAMVKRNPSLLALSNSVELNGPPLSLMDFIQERQAGRFSPDLGVGWVTEWMTMVPRFVFPDRPLPLSLQYMQRFYPDALAVGQGHGYFTLTEGYVAFGDVGAFFDMFLYGAALAWFYLWFLHRRKDPFAMLVYACAWLYSVGAVTRSGAIYSIKAVLMIVIPLLLIHWISSRVSGSRRRAEPRWKRAKLSPSAA